MGSFVLYDYRMGYKEQINWYEKELAKARDREWSVLVENDRLKAEQEDLRNLLFVITRHPEELNEVRSRLSKYLWISQ
jgi:regulator of replication initiation timing